MIDLEEKLRWMIKGQLERPSNYDRRVTLDADDVLFLLDFYASQPLSSFPKEDDRG